MVCRQKYPRYCPFLSSDCRTYTGLARADSCCGGFAASNDSALTCFVSFNNPFEPSQGCIDPVAVFVSDNRCGTAEDCGTRSACVSPHQDSRLMRLKVRPRFMNDHETLVLWSGPAREIFEEGQFHPTFVSPRADYGYQSKSASGFLALYSCLCECPFLYKISGSKKVCCRLSVFS